jgi:hypothetical protein
MIKDKYDWWNLWETEWLEIVKFIILISKGIANSIFFYIVQ